MTKLLKNDIKTLDFILNEIIFKSSVAISDLNEFDLLPIEQKISFKERKSKSPEKEFNRLAYILQEHNVCEITETQDGIILTSNNFSQSFQNNGGFKKVFKESKLKSKRENLEFDLAKSNLEANKLNIEISERNRKNEKFNKKMSVFNFIFVILNFCILIWQILKSE